MTLTLDVYDLGTSRIWTAEPRRALDEFAEDTARNALETRQRPGPVDQDNLEKFLRDQLRGGLVPTDVVAKLSSVVAADPHNRDYVNAKANALIHSQRFRKHHADSVRRMMRDIRGEQGPDTTENLKHLKRLAKEIEQDLR